MDEARGTLSSIGPGMPPPPHTQGGISVREWLKGHVALYNALSYGLQRSALLRRFLQKVGISRDVVHLSGRNLWDERIIRVSAAEVAKLVAGREAWVLIIPARGLWAGDNRETESRVHEAFVAQLRKAGLNVLDMRPALDRTTEPLSHYFQTDPHWNAKGHELAARELERTLVGVVPGENPGQ